jgi:hypothetical protein
MKCGLIYFGSLVPASAFFSPPFSPAVALHKNRSTFCGAGTSLHTHNSLVDAVSILFLFQRNKRAKTHISAVISEGFHLKRPPLLSSVRVLGYRTEMYCVSCEVRTEFIYDM